MQLEISTRNMIDKDLQIAIYSKEINDNFNDELVNLSGELNDKGKIKLEY